MARTPVSRILETIQTVEAVQGQIAELAEAVRRLASRVEALEDGKRRADDR